jgi:dihydrofolate synthase/folylpolyglutamate synthase
MGEVRENGKTVSVGRPGAEDYQRAMNYVLSFADYERMSRSAVVFDLRRVEELLRRLGEPHKVARSVHIAGTKGKGSVAAMISSVLTAAGYRTGLYTSPHIWSMRERIKVDGDMIAEEEVVALVDQLKPEIDIVNREGGLGELTTFEIFTALAFVYFKLRQVDFQILEVGLGGRLDATNVIIPDVCVITSVSLDHTEVLGDTVDKIAAEKAGIIKPNSVVVSAPQPSEAAAVVEKVCSERGAKLIKAGKDVLWTRQSFDSSGQSFRVKSRMAEYDLFLPLLGEFQLENAAVGVAALEVLVEKGLRITPDNIADGLARVDWPGRLQVLRHDPLLVVDGAHNAYSAKKLGIALREYFSFDRLILVVGASGDKDISGMVREFASFAGTVIVTRSYHPRAVEASRLGIEFSSCGVAPHMEHDVPSAIELALKLAGPRDLVCVTGSIFVMSEAMEYAAASTSEH